MTRRQDLEQHRRSLGDIREIMNSMKTLAYMETRKLSRFLNAQQAVVRCIEETAADFLSFHSAILPEADETTRVYLLVGTERGFCGDFNQSVARHIGLTLEKPADGNAFLIAVGRKLHPLIENDARVAALIDGASVAEEISIVLNHMVRSLSSLQERYGMLTVYALYHGANNGLVMQKLLPPFQHYLHQSPRYPHPPVLYLAPAELLVDLTEHYLFAALHEMLYTSFMAENQNRVSHLEGAVKHLEDDSNQLARQCNALRQEEIIEEIEIILLSASSDALWHHHGSLGARDSVKTNKSEK